MRGKIAKKLRRMSEKSWRQALVSGGLESPATPQVAYRQIRMIYKQMKVAWKSSCAPKSLSSVPHSTRLNLKSLIANLEPTDLGSSGLS